jgi:hypothetical protein
MKQRFGFESHRQLPFIETGLTVLIFDLLVAAKDRSQANKQATEFPSLEARATLDSG